MKQTQEKKRNKYNIGTSLSTLLMKYYAKKDLTLETLLKFRLWPEYLKHYSKLAVLLVLTENYL